MSSRFLHRRGGIVCKYLSYFVPKFNHTLRLPLINTELQQGAEVIRTVGLIDSGSTTTFVPTEIAEILNLPKVKDDSAVGAGGHFSTYVAKLDRLSLLKGSNSFAEFKNAEVIVPTTPDAIPYAILGRDYLFHRFQITFREREERVILRNK